MNRRKEVRGVVKALRSVGWRVEDGTCNNKHWRAYSPDGETIVSIPFTPSSVHTLRRLQVLVKRETEKVAA